jgi:bacterioferritin
VLAERILFLKGDVEMKTASDAQPVTDVQKMLEVARKMEEESALEYNRFANESSANADAVSKQLFERLVGDEERHYSQYDIEAENIAKFGERYLALQSIERSKSAMGGLAEG